MPIPGLPRGVAVPSPEANRAIFAAAAPAEGELSAGRFAMPDGRYAVFAVTAVHPGNPAELPPEQREMVRKQFAQIDGAAAVEGYVREIRKGFDIVVEESQL
jgi:peptidyl-prolyl cis-trans isomerase D